MLYALICMGGLGLIFGIGLAIASKVFAVKTDPRVEAIMEVLPNANCGGCGFAGCSAYASAVAEGGGRGGTFNVLSRTRTILSNFRHLLVCGNGAALLAPLEVA